jgi:Ca2+-binding EF-hand superfamily protein
MINPLEFAALRQEFNKIDTDGSGTIEAHELRKAVQECGAIEMSDDSLNHILHEVDIAGTGIINYHEFLAATFNVDKYATRERIASLFQKFDIDGSHIITTTTLRDAFTKLGHNLTEQEVDEILDEHDIDHNRQIGFEEFRAMVLDHM